MLSSDEKGTKLSNQYATYIQKLKWVETIEQSQTESMLDQLNALKIYNLGMMNVAKSQGKLNPMTAAQMGQSYRIAQ